MDTADKTAGCSVGKKLLHLPFGRIKTNDGHSLKPFRFELKSCHSLKVHDVVFGKKFRFQF